MAQVSEADRIAAAQSYIDGLVSHQADSVPFAADCVRFELGIKTGFSGDHLRRSLNNGPQFKVIKSISAPEYTVTGDEVRALFTLRTKPSLFGWRVGTKVDETFVIPADSADGTAKIHHIRASMRPILTK